MHLQQVCDVFFKELGITQEIFKASCDYYRKDPECTKIIEASAKATQRSMMECQRRYNGQELSGPRMDAQKCFAVLHKKLEISLMIAKQFMELEKQLGSDHPQFHASRTYIPYMESDQLFLSTGVELDELDETIDQLRLRITEDMVKDGKVECSPEQYKYLQIVKWFEEQMEKIAAQYRQPEESKKEETTEQESKQESEK